MIRPVHLVLKKSNTKTCVLVKRRPNQCVPVVSIWTVLVHYALLKPHPAVHQEVHSHHIRPNVEGLQNPNVQQDLRAMAVNVWKSIYASVPQVEHWVGMDVGAQVDLPNPHVRMDVGWTGQPADVKIITLRVRTPSVAINASHHTMTQYSHLYTCMGWSGDRVQLFVWLMVHILSLGAVHGYETWFKSEQEKATDWAPLL